MQNKYRMPDYARNQALGVVRGYADYKAWLKNEEAKISFLGSALNAQSKGKGATSAPTEIQALRLAKLNDTYKARCVRAVDEAFEELPLQDFSPLLAKRIKQTIYNCCIKGKNNFTYRYTTLSTEGISRDYFYRMRARFLYLVALKMEII